MATVEKLITDNIDIWSSAVKAKSAVGRGSRKKLDLYGINKLRQLILELAVRGLLVSQDPNDEHASELLKKIATEKAKLINESKIKKQKPLLPIMDSESPFALPQGWALARLGDLSHMISKGTTPTSVGYAFEDTGVTFLKIENLDRGRIDKSSISQFISEETNNALARSQLCAGDLLFSIAGTIGKTAIIYDDDLPANTNQALAFIRGTSVVYSPSYLRIQLDSFVAEKTRQKARGGAMPNVSLGDLTVLVSPVPPLAEQNRIVAKVDELMALCDQLEQQTETSIREHQTLVQTLLEALTNTSERDGFDQAWSRIAKYFDTLFTTEWSIDQLKQTILQLAVMGKLVPQHPNDEPASVILEKIKVEKERLVKENKITPPKVVPKIGYDEVPFNLPAGWMFTRLENLTQLITKGSSPKWQGVSYTENPKDILFVTSENVGVFKLRLEKKKFVEKKFNEVEPRSILKNGDYLMNIVGASIGRTAIYDIDDLANINQAVCLIRTLPNSLCNNFLLNFFNSSICISYMYDKQVDNARPNLSMSNIAKFVIPVAPLAEQHRIVSKVNELMVICEQLKSHLNNSQITKLQLADAITEQSVQ